MKTRLNSIALYALLAGAMPAFISACNKPQDVVKTAPPSTSVGTEIDDSVITAQVKSALIGDADIKSFDFKVETRKGEVQLSGFVDNQTQVDKAIVLARAVNGVKSIDNKVTLKGAATTIGNKVDDGVITASIKTALLADAQVKSFDIAVVTRKGDVQLSGFVDNQSQIDRAVEIAHAVSGVNMVGNEMSIKK